MGRTFSKPLWKHKHASATQHHHNLCTHWLFPRSSVDFWCKVFSLENRSSRLYYRFPMSVFLHQHYTSIGVWTFSNFYFQNWVHIYLLRGGLSSFSSSFTSLGAYLRVLLIHYYPFYCSVLNIPLPHLSCSYLLSSGKPIQWQCPWFLLCGYQAHITFLFLETSLALLIPWLLTASLRETLLCILVLLANCLQNVFQIWLLQILPFAYQNTIYTYFLEICLWCCSYG